MFAKKRSLMMVIPLVLLFITNNVYSEQLGKTQVRALLANKTVIGYNVDKGFKYRAFFGNNGVVVLQKKSFRFYGTWRVDPIGRHCVRKVPASQEICAYIEKMGAGLYRKVKGGEHTHTYRSILNGDQT